MKKILAFLLAFLCAFGLIGCGQKAGPETDKAEVETVEGADAYKIGVIVYNLSDEEVLAFRSYLEDYIAEEAPSGESFSRIISFTPTLELKESMVAYNKYMRNNYEKTF